MTEKKIKNNMSSSCLTRRSRNKDIHSTGFPVKRGMTKDLESGRFIVEMLGVLAIVGVLSVGGITGYTYAMNRHYANELLMGASERAVLVTAQIVAGLEPSLKEFADIETAGGKFETDQLEIYADGIGIYVSGVSTAVCKKLIKDTQDMDIILATPDGIAELVETDCSAETNEFLILFGITGNGENEGTPCTEISECGYCKTCLLGRCVSYKVCDNYCPGDRPILNATGECISCPSVEKGERLEFTADNASECDKCGFPIYSGGTCRQNVCPEGYWLSYWDTCMNCNEMWAGPWKTCENACPNRTQTGSSGSSYGKCKITSTTCTEDQGKDENGTCYDCGYQAGIGGPSSMCRCKNRDWAQIDTNSLCFPICENGWSRFLERCCYEDEIFIQRGTGILRGGKYGYCCPKSRPNWDGSECVP